MITTQQKGGMAKLPAVILVDMKSELLVCSQQIAIFFGKTMYSSRKMQKEKTVKIPAVKSFLVCFM